MRVISLALVIASAALLGCGGDPPTADLNAAKQALDAARAAAEKAQADIAAEKAEWWKFAAVRHRKHGHRMSGIVADDDLLAKPAACRA